MNTKTKKQIIFSIFSIFIIIGVVSLSSMSLVGDDSATITDKTVRYDWLDLTVGDNPKDRLFHTEGGYDLVEFENLGIVSSDQGQTIYEAKATFQFELNSYLAATLDDVFIGIDKNAVKNMWFIKEVGWGYTSTYFIECHTVSWDSINLQKYLGYVPVRIDMNPNWKNLDKQTINGITVDTVDYVYQVKLVKSLGATKGSVGDYKDSYTDQQIQSGDVSIIRLSDNAPSSLMNVINSANLGWTTNPITDVYGHQYGQLLYHASSEGKTFTNTRTGAYIMPMLLEMAPEIKEERQSVHIRRATWDTIGFDELSPVQSYTDYFTRSVHVLNPYIHQEFQIEVYFLATINLNYELYESKLSDPYFHQGDWLWDVEIGGTTDVVLVQQDELQRVWDAIKSILFGWVKYLIIGIIAFIAIIVFFKMLKNRRLKIKYGRKK